MTPLAIIGMALWHYRRCCRFLLSPGDFAPKQGMQALIYLNKKKPRLGKTRLAIRQVIEWRCLKMIKLSRMEILEKQEVANIPIKKPGL